MCEKEIKRYSIFRERIELAEKKERDQRYDERHWGDKPLEEMSERDWRIFREVSVHLRGAGAWVKVGSNVQLLLYVFICSLNCKRCHRPCNVSETKYIRGLVIINHSYPSSLLNRTSTYRRRVTIFPSRCDTGMKLTFQTIFWKLSKIATMR